MRKETIIAVVSLVLLVSITDVSANEKWPSWLSFRGKKRAKQEQLVADSLRRDSIQRATADSIARANILSNAEQREMDDAEKKRLRAEREQLTLNYSIVQMDSLLAKWNEQQAYETFSDYFDNFIEADSVEIETQGNNMLPDSVYIERLHDLVSPIQLPYNSIVKGYISRYTNTRYGTINRIMTLSQYYFPMVEQELIIHDMPVELRAMPVIESALNPTVMSRAGAVGLWQFMPATGKAYGLEINSLVDERCDPLLATKAACRFMKDLYNMYGDWTLAIAAYNCGPGNVNKALARSGITKGSFWDVYYYLPRETRGYVPAFIGASYAYAYHQQHNIEFEDAPLPLATDTIHVNRIMHLGQVAETLEMPIELLRQLNPQYRKDIIPATKKSYALRLPQKYVVQYIQKEQEIIQKDSAYLKSYIDPANIEKARTTPNTSIHRVRSGETLGSIARKYHVTIRQIMTWNGITNPDRISLGQRLKIQSR